MINVRQATVLVLGLLVGLHAQVGHAQDSGPPRDVPAEADSSNTDRDLLESLGADPAAEQPVSAEEVLRAMQAARQSLEAADELDSILAHQQQAADGLRALLADAEQSTLPRLANSGGRADASGDSSKSGGDSVSVEGQQAGDENRNDEASRSTQESAPTGDAAPVVGMRRDLADAVWGHLPDRQQQELRSLSAEQFLPEYSDLIQRYYQSLATERRSKNPLSDDE